MSDSYSGLPLFFFFCAGNWGKASERLRHAKMSPNRDTSAKVSSPKNQRFQLSLTQPGEIHLSNGFISCRSSQNCFHFCGGVVRRRSGVAIARCRPLKLTYMGEIMQCLSVSETVCGDFRCIFCWICSDSNLASISSLLASIRLLQTARMQHCHPTSRHSNNQVWVEQPKMH